MKAERSLELRWNNFGLGRVLLQLAIGFTIYGIDRSSFGVLVPGVIHAFHLSPAMAGVAATSFLGGQAVVILAAGWLSDVWGRKRVLVLGYFIFSIAVLLSGLSTTFTQLIVYRLLSGVGEGIFLPACYAVPGALFAARRSTGQGYLQAVFGLGILIGPIAAAVISTHSSLGWRMPLIIFGAVGLIGTLIMLLTMDPFYSEYKSPDVESVSETPEKPDRRWIWRFVVGAVLVALWAQALWPFLGLGATYLIRVQHLSVVQAGLAGTAGGLAVLVMSLPFGMIADRFGRLQVIAVSSLIVAAAYALFFGVALTTLSAVALTFVIQGFLIGVVDTNIVAYILHSVPGKWLGTSAGVAYTMVYILSAFSGPELGVAAGSVGWRIGSLYVIILPALAIAAIAAVAAIWDKPQTTTLRSATTTSQS